MIGAVVQGVVIVLSGLICAASAYGVRFPGRLVGLVRSAWRKRYGIHLAVVLRLALGVSLVLAAPGARFPTAFQVIGWLAIAAAVVVPLLGRERVDWLLVRLEQRPAVLMRAWCALGVAFGAFLLYGVW